MAQLLFAGEPRIHVLDMEIRRSGPSYTLHTVLEIKARHPEETPHLLMGADMFLSLETWHRAEELVRHMTPAVFARAAGQEDEIAAYAAHLRKRYGVSPIRIDYDLMELSSTFLREVLANRQGMEQVGDAVYREMMRQGHYGARAEFAWLREQAYAMLKPKRVRHVQGTEEEAVRLARRWGVDEDLAREAAILHDITKGPDRAAQLRICEKYGIIKDMGSQEAAKLLHAETGALIAQGEFSVCDPVYDAIRYHTTGRAEMTMLERVLYVADYIEPNRHFAEVQLMREMAYTDLDQTVLYGLELMVQELEASETEPHPDTREAILWLREMKRQAHRRGLEFEQKQTL